MFPMYSKGNIEICYLNYLNEVKSLTITLCCETNISGMCFMATYRTEAQTFG